MIHYVGDAFPEADFGVFSLKAGLHVDRDIE